MAEEFDVYNSEQEALDSPASQSASITPHDTNALARAARSIYVGTAGNITCRLLNDTDDQLFTNVPVGVFPIRVSHVRATGTAASGLVALF